jgi:hypothetical protein
LGSSIFMIDQNFNGVEELEYQNSYWFTPIIWNVLLDKYMHDEIQTPDGYTKSFIGFGGYELQQQLNKIINNCDSISDRICWEISMQQIFFSKDKNIIAEAIKDFLVNNNKFYLSDEDISYLNTAHIAERFNQIADDILKIDKENYPHFVFKNNSIDDGVQSWFSEYDDETDESKEKSLNEWNTVIAEFVEIDDGKISFINNINYFKSIV